MKSFIYLAIIITAIYAQTQPVKDRGRKNAIFLVILLAGGLYITEAVMSFKWKSMAKDLEIIANSDRIVVTLNSDNLQREFKIDSDEYRFFDPNGQMTPKKKLPPFKKLTSYGEVVYYKGDAEIMRGEILKVNLKDPNREININDRYITGRIDGIPCIIKIKGNHFGLGNYYYRELLLS